MKLTLIKILLILSVWCSASCSSPQQPDEPTFYVSIAPLKELVGGIVDDDFPIRVLVPPGASPETFEPTPKQFIGLSHAELIFNVGLIDFETALLQKVEKQDKIVNLCRGIDLIAGSCSHLQHGAADHAYHTHGVDPHIWTSPRALQRMADNAYEAIRTAYPDSTKYARNYERLKQRLEELDKRTSEKLAQSGAACFIIYHPALTYYARDYGLQQIAIESDGKEPSARRLGGIIRLARAQGIRKILYQSQFPASTVETVAHDIGAAPIRIDPLREDAINNIDEITDLITD
ncbi:MAG: zinc ABC transporter substrate-binding protein [Alistipes sp.]|nr:zinc ABC transporter substrate-binding protein [Alistipes sp.]